MPGPASPGHIASRRRFRADPAALPGSRPGPAAGRLAAGQARGGRVGARWIAGDQRLGFIGILAIAAICGTLLRSRMSIAIGLIAALTSIALIALPLRMGLFIAVLVAMAATPLLAPRLEPDPAGPADAAADEPGTRR